MKIKDLGAFQRLDSAVYPLSVAGVAAIYDDAQAAFLQLNITGYDALADAESAKRLVTLARGRHENKQAQTKLLVTVISRCFQDCAAACDLDEPGGLDSEDHAWPFCKPEVPRLKTIADHWPTVFALVCRIDPKQAQAAAALDGRDRFATKAESDREFDDRKRLEWKSDVATELARMTRDQSTVDGYRDRDPDRFDAADAAVRTYLKIFWGPDLGNPEHRRTPPATNGELDFSQRSELTFQRRLYLDAMLRALCGDWAPPGHVPTHAELVARNQVWVHRNKGH